MIAEIEADEGAELYDLLLAVMLPQGIEERIIDRVRIGCHQFAVAQRQLVGGGKSLACGVIADAFVQQLFG